MYSLGGRYEYFRGDFDTNTCPANSERLLTEAACESAARALGGAYRNSGSWSWAPKGCHAGTRGWFYLNEHATGAPRSDDQPVCARYGSYIFTLSTVL